MLILHCGAKAVTEKELMSIPVPEYTNSYRPVSYMDVISEIKTQSKATLPYPMVREQYGLSKDNMQMFGVFTYDTGSAEHRLAQAFCQSLNKSISLKLASGDSTMCCDNLSITGSSFKQVRKNTTHVMRDFVKIVSECLQTAPGYHAKMLSDYDDMRKVECPEDRGAELIGRARYEGVLRPQQASVAYKDWRTPRYDEFSNRDMYSLYNCFTEGAKRGQPGKAMGNLITIHDWFVKENEAEMEALAA